MYFHQTFLFVLTRTRSPNRVSDGSAIVRTLVSLCYFLVRNLPGPSLCRKGWSTVFHVGRRVALIPQCYFFPRVPVTPADCIFNLPASVPLPRPLTTPQNDSLRLLLSDGTRGPRPRPSHSHHLEDHPGQMPVSSHMPFKSSCCHHRYLLGTPATVNSSAQNA